MFLARVAVVALAIAGSGVFAQGTWRFANPRPHGNNIIDMAVQNDAVWQVGDRGSVYTSSDLDIWMPHETGIRHALRGIAFFGGRAYISGEEGIILSGATAGALRPRFLNISDWLESIAASPSELVAVGDNGAIYRSTDGQNWSRQGNFTTWLRGVAYGDGTFVCVGENGFIATSPDGRNWTTRSGPAAHLNRVAFIGDRFWVVGNGGIVLTNNFRFTFNAFNTGATNNLYAVAGNASDIILAGDLILLAGKPSGGPWVSQVDDALPSPAPLWPYYSAIWDGRLFLIGGRTGMKVEGFRSPPSAPLQWFAEEQPTRSWLWSVAQVGDIFAAAGANSIVVTSVDGLDWSQEVVPSSARSEILLGIGGDQKALVAAGSTGQLLTSPGLTTNIVFTNSSGQSETSTVSLLGVFWNPVNSGTQNDLQGVATDGFTYIVTGAKGTVLVSSNGTNWAPGLSGTTAYLSGVTAFPGGFVACGDAGTILDSTLGLVWTPRNSGTSSWIYSVRYAAGKLVAVGQGGLILTSDNSVQWTQRTSGTTEWINDVAYAGNQWVAVAGSGTLITSPDAINWIASKSITSRSLYGIASDGNQLVAVGLEGVILRNQLALPQTPVNFLSYATAGGTNLFLFGGSMGQRFSLEASSTVNAGWSSVSTLEIIDPGGTLIHQQNLPPVNAMFFRTRLAP